MANRTDPSRCQWFVLCTRVADGVVRHPVLGDVPTCSICASRLGLVLVNKETETDAHEDTDRTPLP